LGEIQHEVIIPCYNQGKYLDEAIGSVAERGVDITVVNDASTDDTREIIINLQQKYTFKFIDIL
jgi:glycosyltransferase involved in cell wall biosynthesis